jgi:Zn-dependent oligopeptidase
VFSLVQFKDVPATELPRMYLATPEEIAAWLKTATAGRGDTILYERHVWSERAKAAGTTDVIPYDWRFTEDRLKDIAERFELSEQTVKPLLSRTAQQIG